MIILSHRGFWKDTEEKNTRAAFERTVDQKFGTETDVRDLNGQLVVSHDPAETGAIAWDVVLDLFDGSDLPLAVNVKADGLATQLEKAFSGRSIDWFAFDMSGPETVRYARAGLPFYTRHSDIETHPILYEHAAGVWLDGFDGIWFDNTVIATHSANGKAVCIVSPDLHGRAPDEAWDMLASLPDLSTRIMLCTDQPDRAREFFKS